jgi:hypothetical protein
MWIVSIRVETVVPVVRFALDVDRRLPVDQPWPPDVGPWPEGWASAEKPEAPAKTVMPTETVTVMPMGSTVPVETVMPMGPTVPVGSAMSSSPPRAAYAGTSPQRDRHQHNDRKFSVHDVWLPKLGLLPRQAPPGHYPGRCRRNHRARARQDYAIANRW